MMERAYIFAKLSLNHRRTLILFKQKIRQLHIKPEDMCQADAYLETLCQLCLTCIHPCHRSYLKRFHPQELSSVAKYMAEGFCYHSVKKYPLRQPKKILKKH